MKFFRKIRQQLLTQNKFSRYLVYAIGEIVLVVIGILIALAINNKNQDRVTQEKENIYLQGLRKEFEISKTKLAELIQVNKDNFNGAKQLLHYISSADEVPTEKQFSQLLFNSFSSDILFNPNNSLLQEIINSGSLKDISNTDLRIQLTNWVSTLDDIAKQENDLGIQREKVIDMLRTENYSLRTIFDDAGVNQEIGLPISEENKSNLPLLDSKEFENNILMFVLASSAMEKAHYQPLMDDLNTILQLIESEID